MLLTGAISAYTQTSLPKIQITITEPTNGALFTAPTNIQIDAVTTDTNGQVAGVVFTAQPWGRIVEPMYVINLGTVTNGAPAGTNQVLFALTWTNVPVGTWLLRAEPITASASPWQQPGATPVVITVAPSTDLTVDIASPTNGATFSAPADIPLIAGASASVGAIASVQFFDGTNSLGIVTNGVVVDPPGSPGLAPGSLAYSLTWSNAPVGFHVLTSVATDTNGETAVSEPVFIRVTTNYPPPFSVAITMPTNGSSFTTPTNIAIDAVTFDTNNDVAYVTFLAEPHGHIILPPYAILLGSVSNGVSAGTNQELFTVTWSNALAGSWDLIAQAFRSNGTWSRFVVSAPVAITVGPSTNLWVDIASPTNGSIFTAPANIQLIAGAGGSVGAVASVEFLDGTNDLGTVTNGAVVDPPGSPGLPPGSRAYFLTWSNAPVGFHVLTAVATDTNGESAVSEPVDITVVSNSPPPPLFTVTITAPTNDSSFTAPTNIQIDVLTVDTYTNDGVGEVTFTATPSSGVLPIVLFLGSVSNGVPTGPPGSGQELFTFVWSNAPIGAWTVRASAIPTNEGGVAVSAAVDISVITNYPPPPPPSAVVRITSPPNNSVFTAPVNIELFAFAFDGDESVSNVQFFAGTNSLGFGAPVSFGRRGRPSSYPTNIYELTWTNPAPASNAYVVTSVAEFSSGAYATSAPVDISVVTPPPPPTNEPIEVNIVATDPIAIEGTNCWTWLGLTNTHTTPTWSNWMSPNALCVWFTNCGPADATFAVDRCGATNDELTVDYTISGTASNGVDYVGLPGTVTIPAGQREATITIVPIDADTNNTPDTVILTLSPSTNSPPTYKVGFPSGAEALILNSEAPYPRLTGRLLHDHTFCLSMNGPEGAWFRVDYSTDCLHWTPVCTNQVVAGLINFADPNAAGSTARWYRTVPLPHGPNN